MNVLYNKSVLFQTKPCTNSTVLLSRASNLLNLTENEIYLEQNGRRLESDTIIESEHDVKVILRLNGGKGGFGSMLRAIGAQIEKTTNREACRDLSGRRLRDINEEQRLKNWLDGQAEREKEAALRKRKKLERMCEEPKHEFKDDEYFKERSEIPKRVEDAVLQGMQASCSTKRSAETDKKKTKKKKLWLDDEFEDLSSSDGEESDSERRDSAGSSSETASNVKETSATTSNDKESSETTSNNIESSESTSNGNQCLETTTNGKEISETTSNEKESSETTSNNKVGSEATSNGNQCSETSTNSKEISETTSNKIASSETTFNDQVGSEGTSNGKETTQEPESLVKAVNA